MLADTPRTCDLPAKAMLHDDGLIGGFISLWTVANRAARVINQCVLTYFRQPMGWCMVVSSVNVDIRHAGTKADCHHNLPNCPGARLLGTEGTFDSYQVLH